jgi:hypothetical protein
MLKFRQSCHQAAVIDIQQRSKQHDDGCVGGKSLVQMQSSGKNQTCSNHCRTASLAPLASLCTCFKALVAEHLPNSAVCSHGSVCASNLAVAQSTAQ